jgi:uncharacterized glyoxalase superfamily protein PhnB
MIENRSAAPGPVVPTLVYADLGAAIDWLCAAFGFRERFRYGREGRPTGARLEVGEGSVMLTSSRTGQSPAARICSTLREAPTCRPDVAANVVVASRA